MRRFLYDSGVFLYALGGEHAYRDPCREIVKLASEGELQGEASADLLQEVAHHRFRRLGDRAAASREAGDVVRLCELHPVEPADVLRGLELYGAAQRLSSRDAVFAALALNRGIDAILSTDRAFDEVEGLERIDPADDAAVKSLRAQPPSASHPGR